MSSQDVRSFLIKLLSSKLAPQSITDDQRLVEDLSADSLDLADILMAIEEEYGFDADTTIEVRQIETVGQLIKAVEAALEQRAPEGLVR